MRGDTRSGGIDLRVEGLSKRFGDTVALDDVSFAVEPGEFRSLLGPSGCGKTTTLRCIAGLERPDDGRIYLGDELVSAPAESVDTPPEERNVGMVFQSYAVWPHMTVEENVRYPLDVRGVGSAGERADRARDLLETVGLDDRIAEYPTGLSGGEQQRVAIARALVTDPGVLLFDEPLSQLDVGLRRELREEIRRICDDLDTTVLYVTHSQDEAMYLSDRLSLVSEGRIVEEGEPLPLYESPWTLFGMTFMGQCNTLEGTVRSTTETSTLVGTSAGELPIHRSADGLRAGDEVVVCFRPAHCRLLDGGDRDEEGLVFEGVVDRRSPVRDAVEYRLVVGATELVLHTRRSRGLSVGESVRFGVPAEYVRLFPRP
jgi:iron(III) transport system ATP-binding protein